MLLNVYRNRSVIETVTVDDRARLTQRFFGENAVTVEAITRKPLNIAIGDYIVYNSIRYYVNTLPNVQKDATNRFRYTVVFESEYYDLAKVQYQSDGAGDFNLTGNCDDFVTLLVANMNRVYGTGVWTKGGVTPGNTGYTTLNFNGENCREVMQRICTEFDCEISFNRKQISVTPELRHQTGLIFEYKSGLRGITRTTQSDKNIFTRLYVQGANKNLGADYGANRLKPKTAKNLLSNPGFETGDFTGWSQWGTPVTREVAAFYNPLTFPDGTPVPVGTYAYHHVGDAQNGGSLQTVTVKPDTEYTLSCYVYRVKNPTYPTPSIRLMTETDGDYSQIHAAKYGRWERISVTVTTGAAQTTLTVWIGGIGEAWYDALQIERGDDASPYVSGTANYLERNVDRYGVIEHTLTCDDIFPTRTGTISGVDGVNPLIFSDSGMDFDVNDYLISGMTAKVHFQSGALAGYEFDVETYTAVTKTFQIITYTDAAGTDFPNATLKPAPGDTYVLLDIKLPTSYIDTAENSLLDRGLAYIQENSEPRVSYQLTPDPRYFKTHGIVLNIGDEITVDDEDLNTSVGVRIVELSQSLIRPYEYDLTLSNELVPSITQRLYDTGERLQKSASIDNAGDIVRAMKNVQTVDGLRNIIVAPDGYIRIGLLTADNIITGKLSSKNGQTYFDLDNNTLVIGSASGYAAITDRPTSLAAINSTEGSKLSGIENGADVTGAHIAAGFSGQGSLATRNNVEWATHIASIPDRLNAGDTPAATGVYITPNYIGFYDKTAGAWPVRIKNNAGSGEFYVGDGSKYVSWNGSTLTIRGSLNADDITAGTLTGRTVQTASSGQRMVMDSSDNTLRFYDSGGSNVLVIDDDLFGSRPGIDAIDSTYGGMFRAQKDSNNHSTLTRDGVYAITNSAYAAYCPLYVADNYTTGDGQYVIWVSWKSSNTMNVNSNGNIRTVGYIKASAGFRVDDSNMGLANDSFEDADGNTFTIKGGLITAKAAP